VDCSKHNGISWDGILSCEFLGHYKPDAEAYHKGVSLLRLEPEQAMMVAAHPGDLSAAIKAGLHSAYVHREGESAGIFGEVDSEIKWDVNTRDFAELESQLLD
jgi:2-haloacid dehalogenase